jgi:hypothetical protein
MNLLIFAHVDKPGYYLIIGTPPEVEVGGLLRCNEDGKTYTIVNVIDQGRVEAIADDEPFITDKALQEWIA